jgi:hypothetical protein
MAQRDKTRAQSGISASAAPYLATLTSGKKLLFSRLHEIAEDLKPEQIETIYDRKQRRFLDPAGFLHRQRKRKS